jgi:predicted membrane protein
MSKKYLRRGGGPLVGAFVLIGFGIVLLLMEYHLLRVADLRRFWPVLLLMVGTLKLFQKSSSSKLGGAALIAGGVIFHLSALGYLLLSPQKLWPLTLIAAGVFLLWKAFFEKPPDENGDVPFDALTVFGGVECRISDPEFSGTEMAAIFGGYKVDLRKARMKGDKALIKTTAIFGGIELQVPDTWNVVLHGAPIFGGYSDETVHPDAADGVPQLIIEGLAMFGGISIKN